MHRCIDGLSHRPYPNGTRHTPEMIRDLSLRTWDYRAHVLRMVYERKSGHLGGAFSSAEILTALYFHHLRVNPEEPEWKDRDRLVLSKGHACAMLYTVLAHRGYFPVDELATFRSLNSRLQGHPDPWKTPGVEVAAGPLGHGVAIGAGMALAARMEGSRRQIYVILGDGELNSGVIWEGLLLGSKFGLDNLKVIVDCNGVQQTGTTKQVMPTEPVMDKLIAFNWHVIEVHGHDMLAVLNALDCADEIHGRPVAIVARTTKGKGVSFMENAAKWHGGIPSELQFEQALAELHERAQQCRA
jgi:transketolase